MLSCLLRQSGKAAFELRYVWSRVNGFGLEQLLVDVQYYTSGGIAVHKNTLVFQLDCDPGDCRTWLQARLTPRGQPLCPQNVDWIKKELEYRRTTHHCVASAPPFWPSRLLDLNAGDTGTGIQLIQTLHDRPKYEAQYVALSYCWGTEGEAEQQLKTTSSTLEGHYNGITLDNMTPVIQDAVTAARALSIRYLWIDALCIIQDDIIDWRKESGQMDMVYKHAYITFCTPTSSSCLEGFLARSPPVKINFVSRLRPDIQGFYSLRHQHILGTFELTPASETSPRYLDIERAGTWISRAWTLQEQHLSTRRLYFGCSRIQLHCSNRHSTEPGTESDTNFYYVAFRDQVQSYTQDQNRDILFDAWGTLVCDYAGRLVTNKMDLLPAISGLTRVMGAAIDDTYVAGLWSKDLPRGLLWEDFGPIESWEQLMDRVSSKPSRPYIGPSWSWVTHSGYRPPEFTESAARTYPNHSDHSETQFRTECESVNAWSVPESANLNPYGRITHGELHVRGKLRRCPSPWRRISPRGHLAFLERWTANESSAAATYSIDVSISSEVNEISVGNAFMLLLASSCGVNTRWPTKWSSYEEARSQETVSGVSGETTCTCRSVMKRNAWGPLIYPISVTGEFLRIGIFRISSEQGGPESFSEQPLSFVKII